MRATHKHETCNTGLEKAPLIGCFHNRGFHKLVKFTPLIVWIVDFFFIFEKKKIVIKSYWSNIK
jgi:hypothetical protein